MSLPLPTEPEGLIVSTTPALSPSFVNISSALQSSHVNCVTLVPLSESHIPELYSTTGGPENAHLFRYIPFGPSPTLESYTAHIEDLISNDMFFPYTIFVRPPTSPSSEFGKAVGIVCLMSIVPTHKRIEIGHVLFSPLLQRTTAATETIYLLLKHCFEDLGYRRVEWKANDLNAPSLRAARRFGFVYEGTFRNHLILAGRNRDTAWFSITDDEWPVVKAGLEGGEAEEDFGAGERGIREEGR
jgi:RimJ/RimL family protein N-acetyltransferase